MVQLKVVSKLEYYIPRPSRNRGISKAVIVRKPWGYIILNLVLYTGQPAESGCVFEPIRRSQTNIQINYEITTEWVTIQCRCIPCPYDELKFACLFLVIIRFQRTPCLYN